MKCSFVLSPIAAAVIVISASQIASAQFEENNAVVASPVCKVAGAHCTEFGPTGPIPTIAVVTFRSLRAELALVTFNGSMQCINRSTNPPPSGVIDVTAQIVSNTSPPNPQEPGAVRFAMRLPPAHAPTLDYSAAVNLAASRIMSVRRGTNRFFFRIARNRMDPDTICIVHNGSLNVLSVNPRAR
jgi:hypothetical protein